MLNRTKLARLGKSELILRLSVGLHRSNPGAPLRRTAPSSILIAQVSAGIVRLKIHVQDGTDTILGATIVARHAGEIINGVSLAIVAGIGLRTLAGVIHA